MNMWKNSKRKFTVDSLYCMSLDCVVSNLPVIFATASSEDSLNYLPSTVKNKFLQKLTNRTLKGLPIFSNRLLSLCVHNRLKYLDLSSVPVDDRTLEIIGGCGDLGELNLRDNGLQNVTTEGLLNLFGSLAKLAILDISKCRQFNDDVFQCLANNCPNIVGLHVKSCPVTDRGLINFVERNNLELIFLTISKTRITGDGIFEAVKRCGRLQELRIDDCEGVTNGVLRNVVNCCPKLEILTFYNCAADEASLFQDAEVEKKFKGLKHLHWTINF